MPASSSAPNGISGYLKYPGLPLGPAPLAGDQARALAEQIAHFLVELHGLPPTRLTTSLPKLDPRELLTPGFCGAVRAAVVPHATEDELCALDDWLAHATADLGGAGPPAVTHGDLWYENLLVESR